MATNTTQRQEVASLKALVWLNTLEEGIRTGALVVSPDVSEAKADAIRATLTRFTEYALPELRKQLGLSGGYTTRALRVLDEDLRPSESYNHICQVRETMHLRQGMDGLRRVEQMLANEAFGNFEHADARIILSASITRLDSVPLDPNLKLEPGEIGKLVRSCYAEIEAAIQNLRHLRKQGFDEHDAEVLAENCEELARCARATADHIRSVGAV